MTTQAITIHAGEGCKDILSYLYQLGQDFHAVKDKYPMRTEANRRKPVTYMYRDFSRDKERWTAWAYHTQRGVVVCARVMG